MGCYSQYISPHFGSTYVYVSERIADEITIPTKYLHEVFYGPFALFLIFGDSGKTTLALPGRRDAASI